MVTGRTVEADEARAIGIVSRVFEDDALAEETLAIARTVAGYTSVGLRMTKEVMWANLDSLSLEACLAVENRNQDLAGRTDEVREYMGRYRGGIGSGR